MRRVLLMSLLLCCACGDPAGKVATADGSSCPGPACVDGGTTGDAGQDASDLPTPASPDCNPIAWGACLSGIPSAFYEKEDASTQTGLRVDLPAGVMPHSNVGTPVDPLEWNRRDGFSPNMAVVVLPPKPLDPKTLHDETQPTDSAQAAVVLLDAETGKRIQHFEELDLNATDPSRQALLVRMWTPVQEKRRIVVALTDALKGTDGQPLPRTQAFARIVAGKSTGYARIDAHLAEWTKDLQLLATAGVATEHVVAAWHYDTASTDWTHGVALQARDLLLAQVGAAGLGYQITQVEVDPKYAPLFPNLPVDAKLVVKKPMHADVALRVRGKFETPLILNDSGPNATLGWQGQGPQVALHGTTWRDFVLLVPPSVVKAGGKARLLLYGHGLLRGACVEGCVEPGQAEFMPHLANGSQVVMVGTDWWGLSQADFNVALAVTNDFSLAVRLTDKLVQAAVQPIALTRVVQHKVLADPMLQLGESATATVPVGDSSKPPMYYGNSLGGILGTTMTSMHPDLHRMVMNVAGGEWSTLLNRSSDFAPFLAIFNVTYADPFDRQVLFALMQSLWDLSDPINFADHQFLSPFPGMPADRKALWPVSWGDSQVPNLCSGMLQRVAGQPLHTPAVSVWKDNPTDGALPETQSVWIQWDSKRGTHPVGNALPEPDNGAHLATRWMPEYQQMIHRFFSDGVVEPRYCLVSGRDSDGKLPCDLTEQIPDHEADEKPVITLPLPVIP